MKKNKVLLFVSAVIFIILLGFLIKNFKELILANSKLKNVQAELVLEKKAREDLQWRYQEKVRELDSANNELIQVKQKLTILEQGNRKLIKSKAKLIKSKAELIKAKEELKNKVVVLEESKQVLESKLHSLPDLKKAIREVKVEINEKKIKEEREKELEKEKLQKEFDRQKLLLGNRGLLIKNGKPTPYKSTLIINVRPQD